MKWKEVKTIQSNKMPFSFLQNTKQTKVTLKLKTESNDDERVLMGIGEDEQRGA